MARVLGSSAPLALLAAIAALDALTHVLDPATHGPGALLLGALDEPAHLATAAIVLLALRPRSFAFVVAALATSVAIDLDHLPQLLGSDYLTEDAPRPYPHSLAGAAALTLVALVLSRRRAVAAGVGAGVLLHLFRDTATGSGVALAWPFSLGVASIPWPVYFAALALLAVLAASRGSARAARRASLPCAPARRATRG